MRAQRQERCSDVAGFLRKGGKITNPYSFFFAFKMKI